LAKAGAKVKAISFKLSINGSYRLDVFQSALELPMSILPLISICIGRQTTNSLPSPML
jgi:hypothetical protein